MLETDESEETGIGRMALTRSAGTRLRTARAVPRTVLPPLTSRPVPASDQLEGSSPLTAKLVSMNLEAGLRSDPVRQR